MLQDAKHGRAYVLKLDYSDALHKMCQIVIGIANSKFKLIKKLKQRKVSPKKWHNTLNKTNDRPVYIVFD